MDRRHINSLVLILLGFFCVLLTACGNETRKEQPLAPNANITQAGTVQPISATVMSSGSLTVSVIDVGQGDSILVKFPNGQNMLVDAGTSTGGQSVVNYLRSQKVPKIDILVATHPHEDHIGGMAQILSVFTIGKVWDSGFVHGSRTQERFLQAIKDKNIQFGAPRSGFHQDVGDARIEVLAPSSLLSGTNSDPNNNSLVLRVSYGNISFLLTGDMEGDERRTVSTWPKTTVLKVAHHGSRNGTDSSFLGQVVPQIAVISYGTGNSYGHPHAETVAALQASGAKIYGTVDSGTVEITTDGNTVSVKTNKAAISSIQPNAPPSGESYYIGNRNTKKFHRPSCSSLPAEKNRVYFKTREEAIKAGYVPCKKCNP